MRIQYKLSTLLLFFTLFAVMIGLGYRVYTLSRQVTELQIQLNASKRESEKLYKLLAVKNSGFSPYRQQNPYEKLLIESDLARYEIR